MAFPDWPAICAPLGEQGPWQTLCNNYVNGADTLHLWDPVLCGSLETASDKAAACELFGMLVDDRSRCSVRTAGCAVEGNDVGASAITAASLNALLASGKLAVSAKIATLTKVLLAHRRKSTLPVIFSQVPELRLTFRRFIGIYAACVACIGAAVRQGTQRETCREIVTEHVSRIHQFYTDWGATVVQAGDNVDPIILESHVSSILAGQGLAHEHNDSRHYGLIPRGEPWAKFVGRLPREAPLPGGDMDGLQWVRNQEEWGRHNVASALRLASTLDHRVASGNELELDFWLGIISAERQAIVLLTDSETSEMESKKYGVLRETDLLTPISGHYIPAFRSVLLRKIRSGASAADLFSLPDGQDERGKRCVTVVNWMELPGDCETYQGPGLRSTEASVFVRAPGGGCRVVMTRSQLLGPASLAALGLDDCLRLFGHELQTRDAGSWYAVRAQWKHSSLASVRLLKNQLLPNVVARLMSVRESLASWCQHAGSCTLKGASQVVALRELLVEAVEQIAEFSYYLFNAVMFRRGTQSSVILSHHALLTWLVPCSTDGKSLERRRLEMLRCLPNWRSGSTPDLEAFVSQTAADFVRVGYWESFEPPVGASRGAVREALYSCVEVALRGAAEEFGRKADRNDG